MQIGGNMNRSERPFIFNHMEISLDGKVSLDSGNQYGK